MLARLKYDQTELSQNKGKSQVLDVKIYKTQHFEVQNRSKRSRLRTKISKKRHFMLSRLKVFKND